MKMSGHDYCGPNYRDKRYYVRNNDRERGRCADRMNDAEVWELPEASAEGNSPPRSSFYQHNARDQGHYSAYTMLPKTKIYCPASHIFLVGWFVVLSEMLLTVVVAEKAVAYTGSAVAIVTPWCSNAGPIYRSLWRYNVPPLGQSQSSIHTRHGIIIIIIMGQKKSSYI